jgi:hypothetical protein
MTDQELEALAKEAGFSKVRTVWHSHTVHVDTLQPADYRELRRFYEIAFERGKQEGRNELSKLRTPLHKSQGDQGLTGATALEQTPPLLL